MEKKKLLGKLSQVELREYWKDETQGFTPWLAEEENLELLGEAIGMELDLEGTEHLVGDCKSAGGFKVDILAKTTDLGEECFVVIENQLEKTDHKHLGQLLTYASGLSAKAVVWVAKEIDDEHKKALDWLNENSSENVSFFGLEIELWQIGDSPLAPKFNVVSKPNNWFRNLRQQAINNSESNETKRFRYEFWTAFVEYMKSHKPTVSLRTPKPQQQYDIAVGHPGFCIRLTVSPQKKRLGCQMRIVQTEYGFNALFQDKEHIEKELNTQLEWKELPENKSSVIAQYKDSDFQNREAWPQLFEWLKERAEAFHKTFGKRIQDMDMDLDSNLIQKLDRSNEAA